MNTKEIRRFNVGDKCIAWSNERYGLSWLTICSIEEVSGDELLLYAIEENRSFYRNRFDVMSYEEFVNNSDNIKHDFETIYKD